MIRITIEITEASTTVRLSKNGRAVSVATALSKLARVYPKADPSRWVFRRGDHHTIATMTGGAQ